MNPDDGGRLVNRRWPQHVAALADVTWVAPDGVRYLNPEVALLFKAKHRQPKDDADLAAALPLLDDVQRAWLRDALVATQPGHAWTGLVSR